MRELNNRRTVTPPIDEHPLRMMLMMIMIMAVSYTHLDVYKRQVFAT